MGDRTADTTLLNDIVILWDSNIARNINEKKIDTKKWPRSLAFVIVEQGHSISAEDNTARQC